MRACTCAGTGASAAAIEWIAGIVKSHLPHRPVVVVSHRRYAVIPGLFLAVPLTSRDRGLEHHVGIPADERTGLQRVSYAMTEQVRAISTQRAGRQLGSVSDEKLAAISRYLHLFIA